MTFVYRHNSIRLRQRLGAIMVKKSNTILADLMVLKQNFSRRMIQPKDVLMKDKKDEYGH